MLLQQQVKHAQDFVSQNFHLLCSLVFQLCLHYVPRLTTFLTIILEHFNHAPSLRCKHTYNYIYLAIILICEKHISDVSTAMARKI